jgi:hypothetical protein
VSDANKMAQETEGKCPTYGGNWHCASCYIGRKNIEKFNCCPTLLLLQKHVLPTQSRKQVRIKNSRHAKSFRKCRGARTECCGIRVSPTCSRDSVLQLSLGRNFKADGRAIITGFWLRTRDNATKNDVQQAREVAW